MTANEIRNWSKTLSPMSSLTMVLVEIAAQLAEHNARARRSIIRLIGGADPCAVGTLMYAAIKLTQPETNAGMKQILTNRVQQAVIAIDPEYARLKGYIPREPVS